MLTGVVVVSYHNERGTIRYIRDELSKLTAEYRVVVVDVDASTAHSQGIAEACGLEYVELGGKLNKEARGWVVSSVENLGYAKGNNLGVKLLRDTGLPFDYYLFSNDDVEIKSANVIEAMASAIVNDGEAGGTGPRVMGLDGREQSPHRKYISPLRMIGWKLFAAFRKKKTKKIVTKEIPPAGRCYWVSGAFMMVRADVFKKAGGFDPATFLYYEEVILAERFLKQGKHFIYVPTVEVLHYEGASTAIHNKQRNKIEMQSRMHYFKTYKKVGPLMRWLYQTICG